MRSCLVCLSLIISVFISSSSFASGENRASFSGSLESNDSPSGWVPFAAIGVNTVDFNKNLDTRDGFATNGRAIVSYYTLSENYVYDIGVGADFADLNGEEVNTALVELAGRARLGDSKKWQLGPVVNFNVGSGAGTDYGSSVDNVATFLGLQLARDFAVGESSIIRAGIKGMTDVGIPNSVATKALFELQYGQVSTTRVSESHTVETQQEELPMTFEAEPAEEVAAEETTIVAEASTQRTVEILTEEPVKYYSNPVEVKEMTAVQPLYFIEGASTIGPRNKVMVQRYVQFFNNNKNQIKRVQMVGYADNASESAFGSELSFQRAEQIKSEFNAYGLDSDIVVEAMGGGPLTSSEVGQDLRRARRVDIQVLGIESSEWNEKLKSLHR